MNCNSNKLRKEYWIDKIRECEKAKAETGISARQWIEMNNISTTVYYRWKRKLAEEIVKEFFPDENRHEIVPVTINNTSLVCAENHSEEEKRIILRVKNCEIEIPESSVNVDMLVSLIRGVSA